MKSGSPLVLRVSLRLCLVLLIGLCLVLSVQARTAHAHGPQTLTVSPCDESDLDAAISQANTDNAGDTITFNCNGGSGDITLIGTLFITGSMTLDGSGQNVTLDGNNSVQILYMNTRVSLTLNDLTIANGLASPPELGAGLFNVNGTVIITNSTFTGNHAFGPCGCPIEGGGLFNSGGTVSISNSTFSNNTTFSDSLIDFEVDGGGLSNLGGTVTISNSTFANNRLASITGPGFGLGGGLSNSGTATISNSTFTGNSVPVSGGGLYSNSGTIALSGSIVANNTSNNCSTNSSFGGTITSTGYNLESGTDCGFTGTGDLQNTDPQLDPNGLQNNGGSTQTIALLSSSPAIDHIPAATCPATDQRGMTRPDDNEPTCDIGAYESNYAPDADLALINMPTNMTVNATSPQGAVVTYASPTVVDEDSSLPTANCSPASGSPFAIGTTMVTCTVSDSDDTNSPVSAGFSVTVTPVLTASGTSVSATEGQSLSGVVVATGTAYVNGTPSASIDWGDRHTSAGSVTLHADGSYSVTGSYTYAEEGSFAITVTVSASGVSNATANSSATVSDAALSASTPTAVIGKKGNVTLSTVFSDADSGGTVSDYSATINWGDGSTTSGTISVSGASFTATGSHTYAKHKTYTVTVTIKDAGGGSITKTLTIKV